MIPELIPHFPNSANHPFVRTSDANSDYNCIAWAYDPAINNLWFWPPSTQGYIRKTQFWPSHIPPTVETASFVALFQDIGYEVCANGAAEEGFFKIAIFEKDGKPTHAARQIEGGQWSSKLGDDRDVSHSIEGMEGGYYGNVSVYMRRAI